MLQRNEEQAIFVHDIKNHLIAIAALNGQQAEKNMSAPIPRRGGKEVRSPGKEEDAFRG